MKAPVILEPYPYGRDDFRIGALNIETRKDTCPQDLSIQPCEL